MVSGKAPTGTPFDAQKFRETLGCVPTGVVVVTSIAPDGQPVGLTVSSFSSISLDPPLVAFCPVRSSETFVLMRQAGSFCVNVLSARQERICRTFAVRGKDRFRNVTWTASPGGSPIIDDVVAWIDCTLEVVHDAGDHYIAVGRVNALDMASPTIPLLFFQGGYGGFAATSIAMGATLDMLDALRIADRARGQMETLASHVGAPCHAQILRQDYIVVVASANPLGAGEPPPRVGLRFPLAPPWGELFMTWSDSVTRQKWLDSLRPALGPDEQQALLETMRRIREEGWAFTTRSGQDDEIAPLLATIASYGPTPAAERRLARLLSETGALGSPTALEDVPVGTIRTLSAPVLNRAGNLVLMLSLHKIPATRPIVRLRQDVAELRKAVHYVESTLDE